MSNFQPPGQKIAWLERRLNALESMMRRWISPNGIVSSGTSGGGTTVGVLEVHAHTGTGTGGVLTGYDAITSATVATTDATVTTLATITIPATTTTHIKSRVVARRTGGVLGTAEDGAGYDLEATVKNVAGTATLIGAVLAVSAQESQVLWDATIDVTGATARIRVTGAAQNDVNWKSSTTLLQVS